VDVDNVKLFIIPFGLDTAFRYNDFESECDRHPLTCIPACVSPILYIQYAMTGTENGFLVRHIVPLRE
jgi:hypothetical protein